MKIFLDTADIEEIRTAARWGVLDGVTTNPSLYAKVGGSYEDILRQICRLTPGPVSAEVVAADVDGMLREGRAFAKLARNIVVKVPMSEEGLEAIARFAEEGIKTNCTLIFSANQGLLAAKAGASLISPFVGRLDDINQDGMTVIRDLAEILALHEIDSEIISASIRNPLHVTQSALAGAHIATIPFKILQQMIHHPLTDKGIETFRSDWDKARQAAAAKAEGAGAAAAEQAETPASAAALAAATGNAGTAGNGSGANGSTGNGSTGNGSGGKRGRGASGASETRDGSAGNGSAGKSAAAKPSGRSRSGGRR